MAYNPSDHVVAGKSIGISGNAPQDGRSMYYDKTVTPAKYRAFVSVAEAKAYLTSANQRQPNLPVVVNTGGSLAAGVITGGTNELWYWKDGKADGDLVRMVPDSSGDFDQADVRATPMTGVNLTVPTEEPDAPTAANTLLQWMGILWAWIQWAFLKFHWVGDVFNVEEYGAVPITDFDDPESTPDSTAAIQAAINAWFAAGGTGTVHFPRSYHLSAAPSHVLNGIQHYCQLYIPLTTYEADHFPVLKCTVGGKISNEMQGITPMAQSLKGCTLYSSYVSADTVNQPCVFGYQISNAVENGTPYDEIFKDWNYTSVNLGDLSVVTKTMNSGGAAINNAMSGIDLEYVIQFWAGKVRVSTSGPVIDSLTPAAMNNFGFRCPTANNHATLDADTIFTSGYKTGVITGEHFRANHVTALGTIIGVDATNLGYPATIMHLTTEQNVYSVGIVNSRLNIGTWSGERSAASKWYDQVKDVYTTTGGHISVLQYAVHVSGGAHAVFSSNADFDIKILSDEDGICQIPMNHWAAGAQPVPIRNYVWGLNTSTGELEYAVGSSWVPVVSGGGGGGLGFLRLTGGDGRNSTITTALELSNDFAIQFDMAMSDAQLGQTGAYVLGNHIIQTPGTSTKDKWAIIYNFVANQLEFYGGATGDYTGANPRTVLKTFSLGDNGFHTYRVEYNGTTLVFKEDGATVVSTGKVFSLDAWSTDPLYTTKVFAISEKDANPNNWLGDIKNVVIEKAGTVVLDLALTADGTDASGNNFDLTMSGSYSF